jgi:hypothetical protein
VNINRSPVVDVKARPPGGETEPHSSTNDSSDQSSFAGPRLIVVSGVHSGAGATTVAVALGEAANAGGVSVGVDEFAGPFASGLGTACDAELGPDPSRRWLVGRRGGYVLRRLADSGATIANAAPPVGSHPTLTILDTGWSWPAVSTHVVASAAAAGLPAALRSAPLVLVCRATVPSLRRTEAVLAQAFADLGPDHALALAVLGPDRWPGEVLASIGPRIRVLRDQRRVVAVPLDKRLAVRGVTADLLARSVTAAGRSLLQLFPPTPAWTSREGDS